MKCSGSYVFFILFLVLSWQSLAWDKRHMVAGNVNSEVITFAKQDWTFFLGGSYGYLVSKKIQIEQTFNYVRSEQLDSLNFLTGITYNFSTEINKSFFASGLIGMGYSKWRWSSYSNTDGLYTLRLGKRFALAENISWNLFVEYKDYFESYLDLGHWSFHLFSMSVYF